MKQALLASCVGTALLSSALVQAAANESYIHLEFVDRSELDTLTTIVSIADVQGQDVWAFATEPMLEQLQIHGYAWDVLPYPDRGTKISMATSVDELKKTWRSYPTYEQYVALMQRFAREHSNICRLVQIGETQDKRQLLAVKISDHPDQAEDEPEVFYSATMHGNEPTGYVLMLRLINEILTGYAANPRLTNLVDSTEIWINPLANPDGTYAGGNHTVKYATRALSNGVNLNRNFPDIVEGPHPDGNEWARETQAFMSFAASHNLTLSANFHTGKEVVNYPWDTMQDRHPEDSWFRSVGRAYALRAQTDGRNKYFTDLDNGITNGYDWFRVAGGRQDYMTFYHATREVTVELYRKYLVNENELDQLWQANAAAMLDYLDHAQHGVRGIVTNEDGVALSAELEVVELPSCDAIRCAAKVVSDLPVGDYHRMLLNGTYRLRFTAEGYVPFERTVVVNDGSATRLDVVMRRAHQNETR